MSTHNVIASSATTGFFQPLPILPPQYSTSSQSSRLPPSVDNDNPVLARILSLYLPTPLPAAIHSALQNFARIALSPETLRLTVDAEVDRPTLHPLTTFGEQNNTASLRTSEGWKGLNKIAIQSGMVALGYKGVESHPSFSYNTRVHQHATSHIWAGSAALCECPSSMSDGAAILLGLQLDVDDGDQPGRASVLQEARRRIISRDPSQAWISGQWMTERIGGSDVSRTETIARKADDAQLHCDAEIHSSRVDAVGMPLGRWRVDGFKWFSSATDADMVILLARTPKGISLFYAPMRRTSRNQAVMNGVRLSRLKDKLGTKALPTAELEINGMWAWLIGDEGNGVKEITALLNTTRIWSGGIAVGLWSRGLAISRAFSRARTIKAGLLEDNKQHLAWMAEQTIKFRASTHLLFLGVALLGISERGSSALSGTRAKTIFSGDIAETKSLLRVVTPLVKAQCSLASVSGVRSCMESLGGVGYCENNEDYGIMNVARLFRDVNVNCIWEGESPFRIAIHNFTLACYNLDKVSTPRHQEFDVLEVF